MAGLCVVVVDILLADGTWQACVLLSLTFEHLSHHTTKVCTLIEKKLVSSVTGQEVTAGASGWNLSQIACQPVASRDGTPWAQDEAYLLGGL
jgi:hypothetical protein